MSLEALCDKTVEHVEPFEQVTDLSASKRFVNQDENIKKNNLHGDEEPSVKASVS